MRHQLKVLPAVALLTGFGAAAAQTSWIPVVSHGAGLDGSQWRTEVRVLNVGQGTAVVGMTLHTATGSLRHEVTIAPGGHFAPSDVVSLFTSSDASGALEIEPDRGVVATSRTYDARVATGLGLVLEAVDGTGGAGAGEALYLQQLREGGGWRTNVVAFNAGVEPAVVKVALLDAQGLLAGEVTLDVGPGKVGQSNRPYATLFGRTDILGGFARAEVETGSHVYLFATVIDSATGDGEAQMPQKAPADALSGMPLLDPTIVPQFAQALVVPPVMEPARNAGGVAEYEIAARQFAQQVLPQGFPATTVWGYGRAGDPLPGSGQPTTFHFPAFTIEGRAGERVRVKWINGLKDEQGHFLRHLLPVDQTLHWANPAGVADSEGSSPAPYTGPVPTTTHVHGSHVLSASDGHPETWWLPDANDLPAGIAKTGTRYATTQPTEAGSAVFKYSNDQRAATLWYHDHALGMTRLNVYAGLAGFWVLRDAIEDALGLPGPAPKVGDPAGKRYYEMPIVVQDRTFRADGSLFYPGSRAFFDGYTGPTSPDSPVPPIWNPEFFGNTMVVNGRAWPALDVEPRLYRLRLLNGCNSRTLILALDREGMVFHQIGNEGGLLPDRPVDNEQLLLAPAERADVIVDFSTLQPGAEVTLINLGPDEPFKGLHAEEPQPAADPATTGRVLKFRVVAPTSQGVAGTIPASLPAIPRLQTSLPPRDLTLNEIAYEAGGDLGEIPVRALLGTAAAGPLRWGDTTTEKPRLDDTEIWRFINLTADAHPMHLHLVAFQVLDRTPFDADAYGDAQDRYLSGQGPQPRVEDYFSGPPEPPRPEEAGFKETVISDPDYVTRIIAKFDIAGLYVWHCHIVEHEDNEMMRNFEVVPN